MFNELLRLVLYLWCVVDEFVVDVGCCWLNEVSKGDCKALWWCLCKMMRGQVSR